MHTASCDPVLLSWTRCGIAIYTQQEREVMNILVIYEVKWQRSYFRSPMHFLRDIWKILSWCRTMAILGGLTPPLYEPLCVCVCVFLSVCLENVAFLRPLQHIYDPISLGSAAGEISGWEIWVGLGCPPTTTLLRFFKAIFTCNMWLQSSENQSFSTVATI